MRGVKDFDFVDEYCFRDWSQRGHFINADDFYGRDAFAVAKQFLETGKTREYATITYQVENTIIRIF